MIALADGGDPGRIPIYLAATAMALVLSIFIAGSLGRGGPGPSWLESAIAAIVISGIFIVCAKYGVRLGLPPMAYYAAPLLAAVAIPPIFFHFGFWRTLAYVALLCAVTPLLHAFFFYALGWDDYMPFLHLPALRR